MKDVFKKIWEGIKKGANFVWTKIKDFANEKWFKEVSCTHCGKTEKIMHMKKLKDGTLICPVCYNVIHDCLKDSVDNGTYEDYKKAVHYMYRVQTEMAPVFRNDCGYEGFEVDAAHGLFRINDGLIFEISNILFSNVIFVGEELKEGFFNDKVLGDVKAIVTLSYPSLTIDETIASGVKTSASKKFLSNTYVYDTPSEVQILNQNIEMLCKAFPNTNNVAQQVQQIIIQQP